VSDFLLLTALQYEAAAIAKRLGHVQLRVIGPRAVGLERMNATGCRGVIMAGLAGALDPALAIGDVIVDAESDVAIPPGPWRRGTIHTANDLVSTVEQKRQLFADTGAAVVDMENATVRAFATRLGVPYMGVRAVSDRADEPLDPATLGWVDSEGALRTGRLVLDLCRRPQSIPSLVRLGKRSKIAVAALAEAVKQVVEANG
jgi:hypothetical protein